MSSRENIDKEIQYEEEVIEASKKDLSQFEFLYNKYYESIFRYTFNRIGDEDETSDVVSRIFMNAMNAIQKYECRGLPFGAWLYRIASNEIKKHFRTGKNQVLCLEEERLMDVWTCGEMPDGEVRLRILGELVDKLNDEEVTILQMKFFEDKGFKEIALLMNKKESAVKMRMYRSLNKLKALYEKIEIKNK
ncbi:MAG: sigma-70 family RNA polymerase sigma factor [Cyclobacteriaceae bacterium]